MDSKKRESNRVAAKTRLQEVEALERQEQDEDRALTNLKRKPYGPFYKCNGCGHVFSDPVSFANHGKRVMRSMFCKSVQELKNAQYVVDTYEYDNPDGTKRTEYVARLRTVMCAVQANLKHRG
ncbi:hypothetical protein OKW26_008291 [Paraburkholderia sp. 32]